MPRDVRLRQSSRHRPDCPLAHGAPAEAGVQWGILDKGFWRSPASLTTRLRNRESSARGPYGPSSGQSMKMEMAGSTSLSEVPYFQMPTSYKIIG